MGGGKSTGRDVEMDQLGEILWQKSKEEPSGRRSRWPQDFDIVKSKCQRGAVSNFITNDVIFFNVTTRVVEESFAKVF